MATPTMNMKKGWIRSHTEHPTHGTCSAWYSTTSVPVTVFDSGTLSLGIGFLVQAATEAAATGRSTEEIIALLEEQGSRTHVFAALDTLDQYDWLVFSSVNGVHYLLERLWHNGDDVRRLGGVKLAAMPAVGAGRRKFSELMTDHAFSYVNRNKFITVMNRYCMAEKLRSYR